jgi:serine/threonine protein kinase
VSSVLSSKFEIRRVLGEGGMGVVYEAYDKERKLPIALKTLKNINPYNLQLFKNEFRSLADISHPNLVRFYELFCIDGIWMLSMELLKGQDFLTFVKANHATEEFQFDKTISLKTTADPGNQSAGLEPPTFDEGKLREGLRQLVDGVVALHSAGKVHRDIKPSNIMVTEEGRVVLMDFGLVAEQEDMSLRVVGTPAYMSPEQAAGKPLGEPSDWYSVGALLYHCLTNQLPFTGPYTRILIDKQRIRPPAPRTMVRDIPPDIESLCMALMLMEPDARPTAMDILPVVGSKEPDKEPENATYREVPKEHFVGRTHEMALASRALHDSRRLGSILLVIDGEPGVGKSAFLQQFAKQVNESPEVISFFGKCFERDHSSYKAFDAVLDKLSRYIARLSPEEIALLAPKENALVQVFPAFGRIESFSKRLSVRQDPKRVKQQAFEALRLILQKIAEHMYLAFCIDDIHLADAESVELLGELLRPPFAPKILLTVSRLTGAAQPIQLNRLSALGVIVRQISLGRLSPHESQELLLNYGLSSSAMENVPHAAGHPAFLRDLAQNQTTNEKLLALEPAARRLVEFVALSPNPVPQELAQQALRLQPIEYHRLVSMLRASQFLRISQAQTKECIEIYHEELRALIAPLIAREMYLQWAPFLHELKK